VTTSKVTDAEIKWMAETNRRLQIIKYLKSAGVKRTPTGKMLHTANLVDLERLYISVKCASV
jgi:hypothetical protein